MSQRTSYSSGGPILPSSLDLNVSQNADQIINENDKDGMLEYNRSNTLSHKNTLSQSNIPSSSPPNQNSLQENGANLSSRVNRTIRKKEKNLVSALPTDAASIYNEEEDDALDDRIFHHLESLEKLKESYNDILKKRNTVQYYHTLMHGQGNNSLMQKGVSLDQRKQMIQQSLSRNFLEGNVEKDNQSFINDIRMPSMHIRSQKPNILSTTFPSTVSPSPPATSLNKLLSPFPPSSPTADESSDWTQKILDDSLEGKSILSRAYERVQSTRNGPSEDVFLMKKGCDLSFAEMRANVRSIKQQHAQRFDLLGSQMEDVEYRKIQEVSPTIGAAFMEASLRRREQKRILDEEKFLLEQERDSREYMLRTIKENLHQKLLHQQGSTSKEEVERIAETLKLISEIEKSEGRDQAQMTRLKQLAAIFSSKKNLEQSKNLYGESKDNVIWSYEIEGKRDPLVVPSIRASSPGISSETQSPLPSSNTALKERYQKWKNEGESSFQELRYKKVPESQKRNDLSPENQFLVYQQDEKKKQEQYDASHSPLSSASPLSAFSPSLPSDMGPISQEMLWKVRNERELGLIPTSLSFKECLKRPTLLVIEEAFSNLQVVFSKRLDLQDTYQLQTSGQYLYDFLSLLSSLFSSSNPSAVASTSPVSFPSPDINKYVIMIIESSAWFPLSSPSLCKLSLTALEGLFAQMGREERARLLSETIKLLILFIASDNIELRLSALKALGRWCATSVILSEGEAQLLCHCALQSNGLDIVECCLEVFLILHCPLFLDLQWGFAMTALRTWKLEPIRVGAKAFLLLQIICHRKAMVWKLRSGGESRDGRGERGARDEARRERTEKVQRNEASPEQFSSIMDYFGFSGEKKDDEQRKSEKGEEVRRVEERREVPRKVEEMKEEEMTFQQLSIKYEKLIQKKRNFFSSYPKDFPQWMRSITTEDRFKQDLSNMDSIARMHYSLRTIQGALTLLMASLCDNSIYYCILVLRHYFYSFLMSVVKDHSQSLTVIDGVTSIMLLFRLLWVFEKTQREENSTKVLLSTEEYEDLTDCVLSKVFTSTLFDILTQYSRNEMIVKRVVSALSYCDLLTMAAIQGELSMPVIGHLVKAITGCIDDEETLTYGIQTVIKMTKISLLKRRLVENHAIEIFIKALPVHKDNAYLSSLLFALLSLLSYGEEETVRSLVKYDMVTAMVECFNKHCHNEFFLSISCEAIANACALPLIAEQITEMEYFMNGVFDLYPLYLERREASSLEALGQLTRLMTVLNVENRWGKMLTELQGRLENAAGIPMDRRKKIQRLFSPDYCPVQVITPLVLPMVQ